MIYTFATSWTGVAAVTVGIVLLTTSSCGLVGALRLRGFVSNILGFAIIAYGTIVLLAQILSELNLLSWGGLLVAHTVVVILTLPYILRFGPALLQSFRRRVPALKTHLKAIFSRNLDLTVLGAAILTAMLLGAYLILRFPPNTTDSFLYHLSRVAYWLQHQNMHHFYVPNEAKVIHPINAEIGLLWLTALWGTDLLAGFLQWTATIFTMVAIYGISRRLKYSPAASLFAAFIWSTFTVVVAQATSTKNDIMVTFWVMASVYFLLVGLQRTEYKAHLMLAGLAFGLAAGTKPVAFLALAGLGLMAGWLTIRQPRTFFPKFVYWAAWSALGLVLLGAYNYVLNWLHFGSFFGPADIVAFHAVQNPSVASLVTNLARISYLLVDPTGLPALGIEFIQQWRPDAGALVASTFDINPNLPGTSWGDATFSFAEDRYFVSRDGLSWYGPLGILILFPFIAYQLTVVPFTNRNKWRWFLALTSVGYIIAFALLIRWHPYIGRLMMIGITLGAPLMAGFWESLRNKAVVLRWLVTGIAIWVLGWSATHNFHRPFLGSAELWVADYYELRTIERPYMAPAYRYLDETIPPTARLGLAGDWLLVTWDYLLFGPGLERSVTHLEADKLHTIDLDTFLDNNLDYLLLSANTLNDVEVQVPLWPVTRVRTEWYLAKRHEAEILTKAGDDPEILEESYGDDYRTYLDIKTVFDQKPQAVNVLTTDPRMPFYESDPRFEFSIPQELEDLAEYSHLVISPQWTAADYERLDLSEVELQNFLAQERFAEKIFDKGGYEVYAITTP